MFLFGQAYKTLSVAGRRTILPVSVRGERLMFIQSDLNESNFGVDEHGTTVLMDFQDVGVLPESFVAFSLGSQNLLPVRDSLGLSGNTNGYSMAVIRTCLWMTGDETLGMPICRCCGAPGAQCKQPRSK